MNEYYLGIELGLSKYFAMIAIMMAKITLETADTIDAAI